MDLESLLPAHDRSPADYARIARDLAATGDVLRELADSQYCFVRLAVVEHANAGPEALRRVWNVGGMGAEDFLRLLLGLAKHRAADRDLLLDVMRAATRLLETPVVKRPYAAVLALAVRPELTTDEVRALTNLPGASRQLRRGILEALAAR